MNAFGVLTPINLAITWNSLAAKGGEVLILKSELSRSLYDLGKVLRKLCTELCFNLNQEVTNSKLGVIAKPNLEKYRSVVETRRDSKNGTSNELVSSHN
jgi:hypothetical protein